MLEELDRKILYSLDADSTTSLTKISQEVGISPQLVKYHLARLKKEGLILAYWPMLDFRKLGYFNVSYFLKLKNLSGEKEKELMHHLKQGNNFNIVMRGDGYWDLHFTISAKSIFQVVEIFNAFYDLFHLYILNYETAISVGFHQFRREYLAGRKTSSGKKEMAFTGGDVEQVKLNKKQLAIVESLNKNCRQSYAELAKHLHISRERAISNVAKLKKLGILQSNALLLDHEKIGYPHYRVLLQMTNFTSKKADEFFVFCQQSPNVINFLKLFGNWQALIDVEIESREKLRKLFEEIMQKYGDVVLRIESTNVYKTEKFRDVPNKLED